jgi:hypothetical protein
MLRRARATDSQSEIMKFKLPACGTPANNSADRGGGSFADEG